MGLTVQKDTRSKKLTVKEKLRRSKAKKKLKIRIMKFPKYKRKTFKFKVREISEDADEALKETNKDLSQETWLVLEKGYHNMPTQHNIMIGNKRGKGKTFVSTKGRIRTRK